MTTEERDTGSDPQATAPTGMRASWPASAPVDGRRRLFVAMAGFAAIYGTIGAKLVYYGTKADDSVTGSIDPTRQQLSMSRPDIVDRNGEVLATDIKTTSVYAEPRRIVASVGADEVYDAVASVMPSIRDDKSLAKRLASKKAGFTFVKRDVSAEDKQKIFNLGLPGIGFIEENKRFYPGGGLAAHLLGFVDIDNKGQAGIEKYLDQASGIDELQKLGMVEDRGLQPKRLSVDMRIQHVVRDEVIEAVKKFKAKAGMGIVLDVHTGEVLALVSYPDFNPNDPGPAMKDDVEKPMLNRATYGLFEMGSVFKTFNSAFTLDTGKVNLNDMFEVSGGITIGRQHISEFHGKGRPLNVKEVFIYSSNTGSARMALKVGSQTQFQYFERFGFHRKLGLELPENELRTPRFPKRLSDISTATMAFGHGISVSPMHTAAATIPLMNGGYYIEPTFFPRTREEAMKIAKPVVTPETSAKMRLLFRMNAEQGSGRQADAEAKGYRLGGKTGTAEKVENGRYAKGKNFNSFLSAFPMDDPQYIVLSVLDDPRTDLGNGAALAGSSAGPVAGRIVARIAPMLGIAPRFDIAALPPAGNSGMSTHE
jgi:cell division protein FtsI (penicillin-binding protein 3)